MPDVHDVAYGFKLVLDMRDDQCSYDSDDHSHAQEAGHARRAEHKNWYLHIFSPSVLK